MTLIVAALQVVYYHWWYSLHVPEEGLLFFLAVFVPFITNLIAPAFCIFAAIIAGQSRAWAWLIIFLVTGIIGWFGIPALTIYLLRSDPQNYATLALTVYTYGQPILQAIPAILALVFVWLKALANAATQGGAAQGGQA